jgi:hypothetical protein
VAIDNLARFISECLVIEEDTDEGMDLDTLYGLYISWCCLENVRKGTRMCLLHLLAPAAPQMWAPPW